MVATDLHVPAARRIRRRAGPVVHHGRALAAVRVLLGVRADALADAVHLSTYSLSRLERAKRAPNRGEIGRLLAAVGELADRPQAPNEASGLPKDRQ